MTTVTERASRLSRRKLESRADRVADNSSNAESHRALVEDLKLKLATAHLGGSERSRARHVERGKLLPRDRVDSLVDASSPAPTTCDAAGELRPQARYVG